jgi:hypothetical protein
VGIEEEDKDSSGKSRPLTSSSAKYSHFFETPIPRDNLPFKEYWLI